MKLMFDFTRIDEHMIYEDSFMDEHILIISYMDPWYGDFIIYLCTLNFPLHIPRDG